mgnify:CR=1 FL=1
MDSLSWRTSLRTASLTKSKTGCGATTIALTNSENYIIAVPTTELIENKCYPIKDAEGNVKFWKKHERRAGLSPIVANLFGLYGNFTLELKKKLKDYLSSTGIKKNYLHLRQDR